MGLENIEIQTYKDIAKLPWFKIGDDGQICIDPAAGVPAVIDDHSHMGWSFFFGRVIDLFDEEPKTRYFYDYNYPQDVLNEHNHPTESETNELTLDIALMLFRCPPIGKTQTLPNLLEEMNRFNVSYICSAPIEVPFRSRHARATFSVAEKTDRVLPYAAVHPYSPNWEKRIREMYDQGAMGYKYHPEFQFVPPDSKYAMRIFALCEELDLPVLCHSGCTGQEPGFMQKLAGLERYRVIFESFPKLKFIMGHSGLRMQEPAVAYSNEFENVYLDLAGQTTNEVKGILETADHDKIMYGSDWAFYPMGVTLARTLVALEGYPEEVTQKILHDNAYRILELDKKLPRVNAAK